MMRYDALMDIEQLSRSQTILLTLLVSFVTSIATGIVTVSLMDQAPPSVAQTVNRVIERTVQQVVPSSQSASAAVTQEKTVVVKESELVSEAVTHATPSVVRLYSNNSDNPVFLGLGVVVAASGTIATDAAALGDSGDAVVEISGASHVRAFVTSRDNAHSIAYLSPATTTTEGKIPAWTPISISAHNPVLGESVVALSGKTVARIADGIVTAILPGAQPSDLQIIDTGIAVASIMPGSPLIDTNGSLVGMSTAFARESSANGFLEASVLMHPTPASEASH